MRVTTPKPGLLRIQHFSLDPQQAPTPAEDLLVFGFLVALCERLEAPGLQARPAGLTGWRRNQRAWRPGAWPSDVSTWGLCWQAMPTSPPAKPTHADPDLWIAQLQAQLSADPGRGWTVDTLARESASSPRTLQRRLAQRDLSFTQLLSAARLIGAARMLTMSNMPTAEVGYICGFADQAHFTRQFKQHTAMTPGLYRNEFALQSKLPPES